VILVLTETTFAEAAIVKGLRRRIILHCGKCAKGSIRLAVTSCRLFKPLVKEAAFKPTNEIRQLFRASRDALVGFV
jgi:hypothetical protein